MVKMHLFEALRRSLAFPLLAVLIFQGCGATLEPPVITAMQPCQLKGGQSIPMAASGSVGATYEWSASAGSVTPKTGPAVTYHAPDEGGQVFVVVNATAGGATTSSTITCDILVDPTPTPTVIPSPTLTLTPIPTNTPTPFPPVACDHPSVTEEVFPQLKNVVDQFPFYGPVPSSVFRCEGVYDIVHDSSKLAVRLEFHTSGTQFGFWGISTKPPNTFSAANRKEICFWVYTQQPGQAFNLKFRDTSSEMPAPIITTKVNEWESICTPLTKFSDQGIHLDKLVNINLGFDMTTKDATVWVDDFAFVP